MRRMFGYALLGGNPENVFVVLEGQGRNGKSLVVETVSWILGDLAGPIASELLLDQGRMRSSTGPTPDIMSLRGLRLAFATETDEGCRISPSRVKWLTGGDTLLGRNPHDKYTTQFPPTHTLFLLTNHKPHAPADDFALWERLLRIPFELSFVSREPQAQNERRQDRTLKSKFRAEASGILAWLVRGALEYQRQGLDPPPRVKEAVQEYRRDEDILADWIEERCLVGEQFQASATELYKDFHDWWEENVSKKVPKQRAFGRWLAKKFTKDKSGTVSYQGIGLKSTLY
jgi:putative DNA primase/helicase